MFVYLLNFIYINFKLIKLNFFVFIKTFILNIFFKIYLIFDLTNN